MHMYMCMNVCMLAYELIYIPIETYIKVHTYISLCMYTHVFVYVCVRVCMSRRMHMLHLLMQTLERECL